LQTNKAMLKIAGVPKRDGVATAAELVGNLKIGRLILGCQPQDQPTTEDQSLGSGMGSDQSLQAVSGIAVQDNRWRKWVWHDGRPCDEIGAICQLDANAPFCLGQLQLHSHLRNGHLERFSHALHTAVVDGRAIDPNEPDALGRRATACGVAASARSSRPRALAWNFSW
jgi:hypothetical protein